MEGGVKRGLALPGPIVKLIRRIVDAADGTASEPPRVKVSTAFGVHTVEAKWLMPAASNPADVAKDPKGCLIAVSIRSA